MSAFKGEATNFVACSYSVPTSISSKVFGVVSYAVTRKLYRMGHKGEGLKCDGRFS
jgi:hypothetical protein